MKNKHEESIYTCELKHTCTHTTSSRLQGNTNKSEFSFAKATVSACPLMLDYMSVNTVWIFLASCIMLGSSDLK